MAFEFQRFQVTVPAGTLAAAPQKTSMTMPARIVRVIEVTVPRGPCGNVGFQIASGGNQIVPVNVGTWMVADGQTFHWDVQGQITSGGWQLIAYNTGTYSHTLYVTFAVDPPQLVNVGNRPALISSATLTGNTELVA